MIGRTSFRILLLAAAGLCVSPIAFAGTASSILGLFYTGVDNSGNALGNGTTDSHWNVSYARVNGSGSTSSAYTGASYVVSSSYIDAAWVQNSSSYRWVTAPGASTAGTGGTTNAGGDYLPGNGTSGTNSAYFVYRLSFWVGGTGSGTVTNNVSIALTIAADDQYSVYVNPAAAPTVNNAGTISAGGTAASGSATSAWNNTTSLTLANTGAGKNADFVVGTNYLYIVVANTNSLTGSNGSSALNPSGLLVYQLAGAMTIDGKVVPEVGTILPLVGALGLFGWRRLRRRSSLPVPV